MTAFPRCRAVFLDKDGTLVEDIPYSVDPERMRLLPGAGAALRVLAGAGFNLFVVSNQSGVARGFFPECALRRVEARLTDLLADERVDLAGFYYCPHHPDGVIRRHALECMCRKPKPGLLFHAATEHHIDLSRSWFVGDILDDVEAGHAAGCATVLVDSGGETEWLFGPGRIPDEYTTSLEGAAAAILSADGSAHGLTPRI